MECKTRIIEKISSREPGYPEKRIYLPLITTEPAGPTERNQWMRKNWWWINYNVHFSMKERAVGLALRLEHLLKHAPESAETSGVIAELKSIRTKEPSRRTALESWTHTAHQMPSDIGGGEFNKAIIRDLLSRTYKGKILEAMCGYNSYFLPLPESTIVALDYCAEALERYPFPERLRIECDLNELNGTNHIKCFQSGSFDAVSICFGYRYLENPLIA